MNPAYQFIDDQIARVGDRPPLDVLRETPSTIRAATAGLGEPTWRARPAPGSWSPIEIVAHLADMEWIFGFRLRTIRCDDEPDLMPIDQDAWNLVQTHLDSDPKGQVDGFAALRSANIVAWERIPTTAMERTGYHTGADIEISLRTLMCIQAGHDRRHLEQLERVIAAAGTGT